MSDFKAFGSIKWNNKEEVNSHFLYDKNHDPQSCVVKGTEIMYWIFLLMYIFA
jgi:hypothetical protein